MDSRLTITTTTTLAAAAATTYFCLYCFSCMLNFSLFNDTREMVRKRAVMCLHRFLQQAPDMVQHLRKEFQTALSDKDPSVMWATLHIYIELVQV